jgi:hypothetical protein
VIDGLTPDALERGLELGRLPSLRAVVEAGTYTRGTSVFPSVTPVCLTSIATGAFPDVHRIPHLVWYDRAEERLVEYGSSRHAVRVVGLRRSVEDSVFNMAERHVAPEATTVFEAVEDAGLVPAAITFTCYRGRTPHALRLPGVPGSYRSVLGPKRFFYFNIFESDATGAPLAVRSRTAGSVDAYAAAVGRWLVTRDGFDFLVFYLPDYDYASHISGPDASHAALERADACLGELMAAAGGPDGFLERYAVVVCSDHGQTSVERVARLGDAFADLRVYSGRRRADPHAADVALAPSNRAGMVYRLPGCREDARELARRLERQAWADVVVFREGDEVVARRDGEELRIGDGLQLDGDPAVLDAERYPNGVERARRGLTCPNAGEVAVSPVEGWELADLGGGHHAGGGSHGSLLAGDSTVPVLAAGLDEELPARPSIVDLAPLALRHLRVEPAASMRRPAAVGV